jgi:hypothetical protein
MTNALSRYDQARKALADCVVVDEAKGIRDKAAALAVYAQQAKDRELEHMALEIRLRAERRAGELLRATELNKGAAGNPGGRGAALVQRPGATAQPRLEDMGISKAQSSRWQKLAVVSEDTFERAIAATKAKQARLSTAGVLRQLDGRRQQSNAAFVAAGMASSRQVVEYANGRLPSILREIENLSALAAGCAAALLAHPEELEIHRADDRRNVDTALIRARLEIVNSGRLTVETLRTLVEALPETATKCSVGDLALVEEIEDRLRSEAVEMARAAIREAAA